LSKGLSIPGDDLLGIAYNKPMNAIANKVGVMTPLGIKLVLYRSFSVEADSLLVSLAIWKYLVP
jgi:hypothetical protein